MLGMGKGYSIGKFFIMGAFLLGTTLTGAGLTGTASAANFEDPEIKTIELTIDRTKGKYGDMSSDTWKNLEKVLSTRSIYLKLRIILDGSVPTAVQSRVEESSDPDPVPCEPGHYRRLIMGSDMEYIVDVGEKEKGSFISASIFPGERTEFPYNDVSCVYNKDESKAVFSAQGFYYVLPNPVPGGFIAQLRPINPPFKTAIKYISRTSGVELMGKKNQAK